MIAEKLSPKELDEIADLQKKLDEQELGKVAGGAFPTAVNDQITDAVT